MPIKEKDSGTETIFEQPELPLELGEMDINQLTLPVFVGSEAGVDEDSTKHEVGPPSHNQSGYSLTRGNKLTRATLRTVAGTLAVTLAWQGISNLLESGREAERQSLVEDQATYFAVDAAKGLLSQQEVAVESVDSGEKTEWAGRQLFSARWVVSSPDLGQTEVELTSNQFGNQRVEISEAYKDGKIVFSYSVPDKHLNNITPGMEPEKGLQEMLRVLDDSANLRGSGATYYENDTEVDFDVNELREVYATRAAVLSSYSNSSKEVNLPYLESE